MTPERVTEYTSASLASRCKVTVLPGINYPCRGRHSPVPRVQWCPKGRASTRVAEHMRPDVRARVSAMRTD